MNVENYEKFFRWRINAFRNIENEERLRNKSLFRKIFRKLVKTEHCSCLKPTLPAGRSIGEIFHICDNHATEFEVSPGPYFESDIETCNIFEKIIKKINIT